MYSNQDNILQDLAQTAERLSYSKDWQPTQHGDSEMRIAKNGVWFHQGGEIKRPALVQLFSRLLRREGEQYFLVTPVEKLSIVVEDAPFVSINTDVQGQGSTQNLYVTTNLGDVVWVGPEHPLRVETASNGEPAPYVSIGEHLDVLLQRSDFYQLVDCAVERVVDGQSVMGLWSQGEFYVLGVI